MVTTHTTLSRGITNYYLASAGSTTFNKSSKYQPLMKNLNSQQNCWIPFHGYDKLHWMLQ
jgi:hypothetical protein